MKHLITTSDFSNEEIEILYDDARMFNDLKSNLSLSGKLVVTLFFENSTRTRSSFEIAAKRLGAQVVSLDVGTSSRSKGETIFDTVANLNAYNYMLFFGIVRKYKGLDILLKTWHCLVYSKHGDNRGNNF